VFAPRLAGRLTPPECTDLHMKDIKQARHNKGLFGYGHVTALVSLALRLILTGRAGKA